jgi:predicted N-acyltransferase
LGKDEYQLFASSLARITEQLSLSSAHVLFPSGEQAQKLALTPLVHRYGLQYHWRNRGYASFDDFLSRFSSKRRHQIRRERRELEKQGLEIHKVTGSDWTSEWVDHAFEYYLSTVNKYFYGRQYLNRAFFEEICARLPENALFFVARKRGTNTPVAGAFNLVCKGAMYGRYWGASAAYEFLHFNVCYHGGIEHCIDQGIDHFAPGAGGEHKVARGFEPTVTHSFHHLEDARLRAVVTDFAGRERAAIEEHIRSEGSPIKDE